MVLLVSGNFITDSYTAEIFVVLDGGGITGEYHAPRRWQGLRANIMRPDDGRDYGRMVLKILLPAVQNGLKIPREGAFLTQGRINAPPHRQRAASIGVGIDCNGLFVDYEVNIS